MQKIKISAERKDDGMLIMFGMSLPGGYISWFWIPKNWKLRNYAWKNNELWISSHLLLARFRFWKIWDYQCYFSLKRHLIEKEVDKNEFRKCRWRLIDLMLVYQSLNLTAIILRIQFYKEIIFKIQFYQIIKLRLKF